MRYAIASRRLVTSHANAGGDLGALTDGAFLVDSGRVAWVGSRADLPQGVTLMEKGDALVTAGLVDAHTHAAWIGSRHDEYAIRMSGGDYEAIAKAGGGIASSHRAVAAHSEDDIFQALSARLRRMASLGVTSVEVKSGYGLLPNEELKQLRAIARARKDPTLPRVVPTFLGLHALPAAFRERRAEFIAGAIALLPKIRDEGLAEFVDAYVDRNAFSSEEARAFCVAAKDAGFGIRLHVGQFSDIGGAQLAATLGAASADHLEIVSDEGARALGASGVYAGLLPTACFTLRQEPPPIERLRDAKVRLVVASDANPGTAPSESLPLAMAMSVRLFGLSVEEALLGATLHAADSLGLGRECGSLEIGKAADFVVWDLPHEAALVQPWGVARATLVARAGVPIIGEL